MTQSAHPNLQNQEPSTKLAIEKALSELGQTDPKQIEIIRKNLVDMYTCREDVLWAITKGGLPQSEDTQNALQESLSNSMMEVYIESFMRQQSADEESLQRQYDKYKKSLGDMEYELRIITVQQYENAASVVKDYSSCRDFSSLARKYSTDVLSSQGGYVGWVANGLIDANFSQILMNLKPFQISAPIQTPDGFHLLFIEAVRPVKPASYRDIRPQLEEAYRTEKLALHLAGLRRTRLQS